MLLSVKLLCVLFDCFLITLILLLAWFAGDEKEGQ